MERQHQVGERGQQTDCSPQGGGITGSDLESTSCHHQSVDAGSGGYNSSSCHNQTGSSYFGTHVAAVCEEINSQAQRSLSSPVEQHMMQQRRESNRQNSKKRRKRRSDEVHLLQEEQNRLVLETRELIAEKAKLQAELDREISMTVMPNNQGAAEPQQMQPHILQAPTICDPQQYMRQPTLQAQQLAATSTTTARMSLPGIWTLPLNMASFLLGNAIERAGTPSHSIIDSLLLLQARSCVSPCNQNELSAIAAALAVLRRSPAQEYNLPNVNASQSGTDLHQSLPANRFLKNSGSNTEA